MSAVTTQNGSFNNRSVILTIEDDAAIRRGIVDSLSFNGYRVIEAADGVEGLNKSVETEYDLLLLDLALPGLSGLEILRQLKKIKPTQPVIILTAKGDESDRVRGLREGADDYVVKPFSVKELMARVEAVLRRSPERPTLMEITSFPHGVIDFERRELRFENQTRNELSEKEVELLQYLVSNRGRAISRDELLSNVWQLSPKGISTRTIDMHIARLREKLKDNKEKPEILLTVRGKGYMWAHDQQESGT
ncbi:MAG: response regulator transcription factor [Planctomycetota bacterium]